MVMEPGTEASVGGAAPVVILYGWSGSVDKHLRRYATVWADAGFPSLRGTAPLLCVPAGVLAAAPRM